MAAKIVENIASTSSVHALVRTRYLYTVHVSGRVVFSEWWRGVVETGSGRGRSLVVVRLQSRNSRCGQNHGSFGASIFNDPVYIVQFVMLKHSSIAGVVSADQTQRCRVPKRHREGGVGEDAGGSRTSGHSGSAECTHHVRGVDHVRRETHETRHRQGRLKTTRNSLLATFLSIMIIFLNNY